MKVILAVYFLSPLSSWSTTFFLPPFPDRVEKTEYIARGITGNSRVEWVENQNQGKQLYTITEFSITEALKGGFGQKEILLYNRGGTKDGVTLSIPGSASFRSGENVVLFLEPIDEKKEKFKVSGLGTGKFSLQRNQNGEEILEGFGLEETEGVVHADQHDHHHHEDAKKKKKWSYQDLKKLSGKMTPVSQKTESAKIVTEASTSLTPENLNDSSNSAARTSENQSEVSREARGLHPFWKWAGIALLTMMGLWAILKK